MKYQKKARSFVALLLALVMMMGMLPTTAFASEGNESDPVVSSETTVPTGTDNGTSSTTYTTEEDTSTPSTEGEDDSEGEDSDADVPATIEGDGFSDGETVFVSEFTPLNDPYGIATLATVTGTITTGNPFTYAQAWVDEFSPYSSCETKFFNDQPAYCIEPHKATANNQSVTASEWMSASKELRLALAYGYGGVNQDELLYYAGTSQYRYDFAWLATQEVIWEIVGGYTDLSDLFIGPNHSYDPEVAIPIANAHDYIWERIYASTEIPSFAVASKYSTYNDIELSWNGLEWTATVTDTNRVLPNFDDFEFALDGVTTYQSGYTLTIDATSEAAKSMLNGIASYASEGSAIDPDDVGAWLLEPSDSSLQDCVALNGRPDPVYAYVRAKVTQTTGDLTIVKTSEDNKISGVSFTITGPNSYSKTTTTNAQGKITLTDLPAGTYTVKENAASYYVAPSSQTVTVDIGETSTVTFHNTLMRGTLKVTKTSEDNVLSGHTFKLTGTSSSGQSVSMTATTNASGVATFSNVLIGTNYTVQEVNTAAKYVTPAAQTGKAVNYNQTTSLSFTNKLARGAIQVTKTSEDGAVSGHTFKLTGTSTSGQSVSMTATTNASGVATFSNVLIGTNYTVQEINTATKYVVPAVQKNITVSLNNTTKLTFNNKLARGAIQVTKTSEDGAVSGHTFKLTGTSTSGQSVSMTATTNASGVATFSNVLIGTNYTVQEINTATKYVVPAVQKNITVTLNNTTKLTFYNELKKGTVQVVKTSEDNKITGHTFKLTGTSFAGTNVSMTATTNAQGIATFNNVPIGSDYKIEEINTAAKYIVPAAQTDISVTYKATTTVNFENVLARGNLKITKTSEDGFIEGMTFRLSGTSTSGAVINETATTDSNGIAIFTDILIGTNYTVEEINTAERYAVPDVQKNVTISLHTTTRLTFHNALARGSVEVTKTSEDNRVSGITFRLYGEAINGENVDLTAVTNAQGIATFENILIGNSYTLEEVNIAAKYVVPAAQENIRVTLNTTTPLTVYNAMKRGELSVTKTSEDGLVEGVTFRLYGTAISGDTVNMTATTDANGVAVFRQVLIGNNYTLEEVDTAVRYVIPEMKTGLVVTYQGNTPVDMENVLKKWRVTVEKTDAEKGNTPRGDGVFAGAIYGLYKGDSLVKQYSIGEDGSFTTDYYVCSDDYTIKEIAAPAGYQLDTTSYKVGSEAKDYTIELNVAPGITSVEQIKRGTFSITKFISDGTSGPAKFEGGATFQYWLESAGSYEDAKADERGTLTTNTLGYSGSSITLPYGRYVVHQTAAGDKGAGLAPDFTVFVGAEDGDHQDLAVNNGPITAYLRVVKVDADDDEVIPWGGAEFEIYDPDGNKISQSVTYPTITSIDKFVTNDDGYFVTPLVLPYGEHYRLVETKAPTGYQLMEEALVFDITPATIELDVENNIVTVEVIAGDSAIPPTVKTSAADKDGNKELIASLTTTIVDTVTCEDVIPNKTYTVIGTLMLRSTGEPLKDGDGNSVTATNTFVAKSDFTGSVEMEFTFDSTALCGDSVVVFESLRRGTREVATHADLTDTNQTVTFKKPKVSTTATNSLGGKSFFPMEQVTLVDTIAYEDFPVGVDYIAIGTLMDKATGNALTDKNGEPVTACKVFNPTTSSGTVEVQFLFDSTELSGKELVVFERVYRGTEIVPSGSATPAFAAHEDLDDEGQTVTVDRPEIKTTATNNVTGTKVIELERQATIKDTVTYTGLIVGEKYTISGVLMDKATGKAFLDGNGKEITASTTFTAQEVNGSVDVIFTLNTTKLCGATIVVFEHLLYKDVEIAAHSDIDDVEQTVTVINPTIKTSATNNTTGTKVIEIERKAEIKDTVSFTGLTVGEKYTVSGTLMDKTTGNALLDDNGREITASTTFTAQEVNGSVDVIFTLNTTKLCGATIVVFERLLYKDVEIAAHADIDDVEQTVTVINPTIKTLATNSATGGKVIEPETKATIKDTVTYTGLTAGEKYTVSGVLMDKATGKALLDGNSKEITASTTFTAQESSGSVDILFTLDATALRGAAIVAFEYLSYRDVEIATHTDINDADQTVTVSSPSIKTSARNAADEKQEVYAYTKVELVDTVTYEGLVPGSTYTLTGVLMDKATGKVVPGRNNKEITATTTFEATSSSGSANVIFVFDASLLGGKTLVVFETLTINGSVIAEHKDIDDAEQTVVIKRIPSYSGPTIATTATFDGKSQKFASASANIKIVDTVNYTGLTAGKVYVLAGTLMDKDTGVALKDKNGSLITATTTFTPKTSNGAVNVTFAFDASNMKDKAVVVFETLYEGRIRDNRVIATHNDIADGAQTVYFSDSIPTGDVGISTWGMIGTCSALAATAVLASPHRRRKQQTGT